MGKGKITYNKPVFVGAAVLDISKCHMVRFYYNYVKPKYGNRVKICYKDTESLTSLIQTKDLANDPQLLDELDTRPTHPLYLLNQKQTGFGEVQGKPRLPYPELLSDQVQGIRQKILQRG
jgi:hypothetical protein